MASRVLLLLLFKDVGFYLEFVLWDSKKQEERRKGGKGKGKERKD